MTKDIQAKACFDLHIKEKLITELTTKHMNRVRTRKCACVVTEVKFKESPSPRYSYLG